MKPSDIRNALLATPLYNAEGDSTHLITDKQDRQRLMLLITRDRDVIADLLHDALDKALESGVFCDAITNGAAFSDNIWKHSIEVTTIGASLFACLSSVMNQYIDKSAEDWLDLVRGDEWLDRELGSSGVLAI